MRLRSATVALTTITALLASGAPAAATPRELTGEHADGTYVITVPPAWDGTLLLVANRTRLDTAFQEWATRRGFAVAGTASRPGWQLDAAWALKTLVDPGSPI